MSTLAIRLLVLSNALLLTLPQGWCMALTFHRPQKSAPPKVSCCSCCHHSSRSQAPVPKPVPGEPFKRCCSRGEITVPPRLEAGGPDVVVATALPAMDHARRSEE